MDSSIRNQPTADGTSINLEILASEKGLENGAECVSSTNETVRVNVFPAHLRETSFDIWLHSSKKEITDPISNGIVSSRGTMASSADGLISSFVDIELKKADVDDLLTEHHKSKELFEERSLASERPSSPSSSKSFEVLAWVVNQEQSSNEHQLKRLDSLDIEMDGHGAGRIMNKSNSQENCFHSSDSFPASEISYMDNAVQFDSENDVRCAQGQEFEMVNGCNSTCNENLRKQSASTSCLTQPLLKSILDAMETKFEAFRRIIKAELGGPDSPPKWFLEYMEVEKLKENFESHAEQQATKIRLQNALTELETTRAEMVKVQKESVRNTAIDWTAITSLRNELNRVQNELALESSKHTEEISTFEKENAATAHALEKIQKEARLLKSSLESSLSENEGALVQLQKTKGQLEEALDRESSLKLQLEELQNHLSAMVKKKDEDSYKHAKDISSLEERNTATVHALEEALCRENALKIELEKLQNELCAVTDEKDKKEHSQVPVQDVTLPSYVAEKEETIEVAEVSTSQVFNSKILSNPVLPVEPIADLTVPTAVVFPAAILQIRPQFPRYANQSSPFVQPRFSHSKNPAQYFTPFPHTTGKVPLQVLPATQKPIPQNRETMLHAIVDPNTNEEVSISPDLVSRSRSESTSKVPPPVLETSVAAPEESIPIPQNTKREPDVEEGKESNFPAHSPPESPLPEIEQYENLSVKLIYPYKEGQWSPLNPGGTKKYDREFLKMIQGSPLAKITPNIRAEISSTGQAFKQPASWNQGRKQMKQGHFDTAGADTMSPAYLRSSMHGNRAPLPQHSSQGKGMHRPTTLINIPVAQSKAAFPKVENARVPDTFAKKKVTDKEEQKTIDLKKSVRRNLNKLTPENYDKISKNILHMEVDTEERLSALVQIFFDKAVGDPIYAPICSNIYAQIYAELCKLMFEKEVPSASGTGKVSFRKLLLDRCQQTFEKEKKDEEEIVSKQKALEEADTEEKKKELQMELNERIAKTKRIMLGNIRFIGELFKLRMLTIKIMNFCISKLLKSRDEEQLECLCKLISTIGKTYEEEYDAKSRRAVAESKSSGKQMQFQLTKLDVYLDEMRKLSQSEVLSFPIRSMLMDVLNLKQNRWVPYREGEKPKTKKNTKKKTKEKERLEKEGRGDDQSSYRPPPKMTSQPREMKLGPTKAWSKGAGLTPTAVQTGGGRYSALLDDEGSSVSSPSVTNIRLGPPRSMGHRGAATESMGPVPTERQKAVQASRSFTRSRSQQASRESSLSRQGAATPTTEQVPFQAKSELKGKPDLTEEGNETKILPDFVLRGCMQLLFGVIVQ